MSVLGVILGLIVFTVFVIFVWEMIKSSILETLFINPSIYEVMEYIDNVLRKARLHEYDMIFRTPDCKSYDKFKIHVVRKGDKEVIVIDLI